jgi:SAM-dependent methyltransferase
VLIRYASQERIRGVAVLLAPCVCTVLVFEGEACALVGLVVIACWPMVCRLVTWRTRAGTETPVAHGGGRCPESRPSDAECALGVNLWLWLQRIAHGHWFFYYRHIRGAVLDDPCTSYLDVGCGPGTIVDYLETLHPVKRYWGVDTDLRRIRYAQRRFSGREGITFVGGRLQEQKLEGTFECCILVGLIHHVPDEEFLELMDILRAHVSKRFLILEPIFTRRWPGALHYRNHLEQGRYHRSIDEIRVLLGRAGLRVVYQEESPQMLRLFDFWAASASLHR